MMLKGELANEADVRRFRLEAEASAKLDHAGTCKPRARFRSMRCGPFVTDFPWRQQFGSSSPLYPVNRVAAKDKLTRWTIEKEVASPERDEVRISGTLAGPQRRGGKQAGESGRGGSLPGDRDLSAHGANGQTKKRPDRLQAVAEDASEHDGSSQEFQQQADEDVVAGVGADDDAEAAEMVEDREIKTRESAKEEDRQLERFAGRAQVMGAREEEGREDRCQGQAPAILEFGLMEERDQAREEEQSKQGFFVDPGADVAYHELPGFARIGGCGELHERRPRRVEHAAPGDQERKNEAGKPEQEAGETGAFDSHAQPGAEIVVRSGLGGREAPEEEQRKKKGGGAETGGDAELFEESAEPNVGAVAEFVGRRAEQV